jgi:hypothetical protein
VRTWFRSLAGTTAAILLAATTAGATLASPPASVTITDASLTARIMVTLGFDVACDPLVGQDGSQVTVAGVAYDGYIDQASGRTIAHAEGGDRMPDPGGPRIVCDGATVTRLTLSMVSSTVPFHGGAAVAGVRLNLFDPACEWCGSGSYTEIVSVVKLSGK